MNETLHVGARREFAESWPVVLAAALAISVGMTGIGFYSLGLFVKPLQEEFGWSRAAVSGAATFQQFGIFLSAPLVGRLADRIGARKIAIASYIATPLALVALAQAGPSVPAWYALWLMVSLAGCGTTPAIWARVVSLRFDNARGLALGLMLVGTGVAAVLAPALLGRVFVEYGWRNAVLTMAAVTLTIGLPVSLLMGRERVADPALPPRARGHFEMNRATAMLVVVAVLLGAFVAGLIVHLVPMLVDRGVDAGSAARVAATVGVAVLIARVVVGYLFDRFHAPYVAALFLLSPVIASLILWGGGPVVPAAMLLGLAAGAEVDMLAYFTSRYAHMENYGATYGVILGLFSFGAGCGPLLFGFSVDFTGSYQFILLVSALVLLAVVGMIVALGPYRQAKGEAILTAS
jgi:MFS family permease